MRGSVVTIGFLTWLLVLPARAVAQQPGPESDTTVADRHDVISEREHHYIGKVEMQLRDTKLYADDVWYYVEEHRAVATGNVVFRQGSNQIAADRAEFDTNTRLGTFYNASGFATVQPPRPSAGPGVVAPPPIAGQDTVVLFIGETVEKIGPRKYRIKNGGFTTCVQPTPRWNFNADTIVLNLDHYTLLTNVVMTVKGVPLLYLPALYYPTKREDRATGFLLPTYGSSTYRGHSFHNAFFWAIDRSQDATMMHDWFSKAGQGVGTEYRYNFGGGSDGTMRAYVLDQHPSDEAAPTIPTERSYDINGVVSQPLPGRFRSTGRVDYFSSIATNQNFNTNIADASRSRRSFGGNVVGSWRSYMLTGRVDQIEYFSSQTSSQLTGSWPRINVLRNERPIGDTALYFSSGGEVAHILSDFRSGGTSFDQSLTRLDFSPQVRFPFTRLQWFTVNSTLSWRDTYYSRSYAAVDPADNQPVRDPVTGQPIISGDNLNRQFFTVQSQITGPVFNRIWDTPQNGYAERFKHSVEPYFNAMRTSAIENQGQIIKLDGTDHTVGGNTQLTYGITNRFYAKRRAAAAGQPGQAREIVTVDLRQVYYSQAEAARADPQNSINNTGVTNNNFSPISLTVRAQPTLDFNATARVEIDSRYRELRTMTVSGTYNWSTQLQSTASWSKRGYIPGLSGFDNPATLDHTVSASSTVRTRNNKYGSIYSFNYDVLRSKMIQQRLTGFYNAQCCGVAFEYQTVNFNTFSSNPSDRRFFMSFTLAGLGNFSPFNGALGGIPR
jgi:LPS-assembly protein